MRRAHVLLLPTIALLTSCSSPTVTRTQGEATVTTFDRGYTNTHVVSKGGSMFMVDSGLEEDAPDLVRDMRSAGIDPKDIRAIVITHGHTDHAGGASYFARTFGTPIIAGAGDHDMLAAGANDTLCPTNRMAERRLSDDQAATYTPVAADVEIDAPTSLEALTGIDARVIPLPGHTEGSVVIVLDDLAFVGDLLRGSVMGHSAEVHFYMCDLEDNQRDVRALLDDLAPGATTIFPGHFGPLTRDAVDARFAPE